MTFSVKPLPTVKKFGKVIVMDSRVNDLTPVKKEEAKVINFSTGLKNKVG